MIKSEIQLHAIGLMRANLCGAKARQNNYQPCRQPAIKNKLRCRLHGGKSTGAKTAEGKIKSAQANLKHGLYTQEAMNEKQIMRDMMNWRKELKNSEI